MVELCQSEYGKLDILVNNAGGAPPADSLAQAKSSQKYCGFKFNSSYHFSQVAGNLMRASSDSAVIINISSVSGMRPNPFGVLMGQPRQELLTLHRRSLWNGDQKSVLFLSAQGWY
ncbi:MAG: hypothetical protein CM15mP49_30140 [Actinomycetota bacterium]|nr:MAG: hypothetical protein CM15mP49_30140 [Actinomycetota bacterium]